MNIKIPSEKLNKRNTHVSIDITFQPQKGVWLVVTPVEVRGGATRTMAYKGYRHCLEPLSKKLDVAEDWVIDNQAEIFKRFIEDPAGNNIINALRNYPENIPLTTLTEPEIEEMLDLVAKSFPEWKNQDDWWTGNTKGVNISEKGYDLNIVNEEFAEIESDEIKIVLYGLKERDKNDPDYKEHPLEVDMTNEIYSTVVKTDSMAKRHNEIVSKNTIIQPMAENDSPKVEMTSIKP